MKQDDVIRLAEKAHRELVTKVYVGHMAQLDPWTLGLMSIFAELVAEHEREKIKKANKPELEKCNSYIKEIEEQCRINGMGQEREWKLMTEVAELKKKIEQLEKEKQ